MNLWDKNEDDNNEELKYNVKKFTVGNDLHWDQQLAQCDVQGTLAHAKMLEHIGLLDSEEFTSIENGLNAIKSDIECGTFYISEHHEDVHSEIEFRLIRTIGEAGKKIHSGRSRNDQALTAIKLFLREQLKEITNHVDALFNRLCTMSENTKNILMPGYTHMQIAMPSSFGLWFGAYAESLCDDLELVYGAIKICNRNPLGSAAGYGSSFPIDRELTTKLLHFESMNYNSVYAQMTRGKSEKSASFALASIAHTLSRLAMDLCLYSGQNFGFFSLDKNFTTGSSIMPHKKNPDVFELIRGRCNRIQAVPNELTILCGNLPTGYHRDMQLTKECLFPAFESLKECLHMMEQGLIHIKINEKICAAEVYNSMFSVEEVNALVLEGIPFRDAYRRVAAKTENPSYVYSSQPNHTHAGSIGNLCNEKIRERFYTLRTTILDC